MMENDGHSILGITFPIIWGQLEVTRMEDNWDCWATG
jgi:hypothetical protein